MKKIGKRIISLLLVAAMIIICVPVTTLNAKTQIKLSKRKIRMTQGKEIVLKLKGVDKKAKIKWYVSKKGVVKLKNSKKSACRVKAKKQGTTYVKAKYKGKIYRCKVTVVKKKTKKPAPIPVPEPVPEPTPEPTPTPVPEPTPTPEPTPEPTPTVSSDITFNGKKYELSFDDEFDSFDPTKWEYCPEKERQDAGCEWKNSCSSFENGEYVLTCYVDDKGTPLSGGIQTKEKFEQTYGLYHMRFKMEKSSGLWYAFWLLTEKMHNSVGNGATDGAEQDVFELVPNKNLYAMAVHWDGYHEDIKHKGKEKYVKDDFYDEYHELWYEWDKDGYRLYLDGTDEEHLMMKIKGEDTEGTCAVPCYMILSAEFGTYGGEIKKDMEPAHFYVDYVRAYKEKIEK
ncbi:MAG: glycoside hydrolase family 16 protein [Eubacterium sp.]|nr:glycoside hydrolase family 16 protein [Eubacterium sp.]